MSDAILSVREIQPSDIPLLVNYWLGADELYLDSMGVDLHKLPSAEQLSSHLFTQIETPLVQRNAYCIIWLINGRPVGHCNTNPTSFGKDAFMHLHIWEKDTRSKGIGSRLLQLTLPYFFENLQLKNLYCQPYALNPAPHKTLEKLGFEFVKEYVTIPGSLNYEQPVKLWQLSYERYRNGLV